MRRLLCVLLVFVAACGTRPPTERPDPVVSQLEAGEQIAFRIPAQLLHGHDMEEPYYDPREGYRPIPTFQGELAVTDRRLLFVERSAENASSWLSIPYAAVARSRPSRTALLHYLVVWDKDGHPDSFVVDRVDVGALHRYFAQAMATRIGGASRTPSHRLQTNK